MVLFSCWSFVVFSVISCSFCSNSAFCADKALTCKITYKNSMQNRYVNEHWDKVDMILALGFA